MKNLRTLVKDLNIRSIKDLIQAKLDNKLPDLEIHFNLHGNLSYIEGFYGRLEISKVNTAILSEVIEESIPKDELAIALINNFIERNDIESKAELVQIIIKEDFETSNNDKWYGAYVEIDSSLKVTRILFKDDKDEEYEVPLDYLDSILTKERAILF